MKKYKEESRIRKEAEIMARKEAKKQAKKGIPIDVKVNRFDEIICPVCGQSMNFWGNTGLQKCDHCGAVINVVR